MGYASDIDVTLDTRVTLGTVYRKLLDHTLPLLCFSYSENLMNIVLKQHFSFKTRLLFRNRPWWVKL